MIVSAEDIIRHIRDLPSLPEVVVELLASIEQEDVDLHQLAAKITRDQSLTAKTLRLANSSFYGMQSKVTSIAQAITVLGLHSIRTLVTACSLTRSFAPGPGNRFDFQGFWRHSVGAAVAAKALAPHLGQAADAAFTAALLHDIGTLVLVTRYPAQYEEALAYRALHDCAVADAERAVFGLEHALVGSMLATHWKFPAAIVRAVANHHALTEQDLTALPLAVHAANLLAHALDLSGQEGDLAPPVAERVWRALALSDAAWLEVFRETEAGFEEMCQILVD